MLDCSMREISANFKRLAPSPPPVDRDGRRFDNVNSIATD